VHYFECIIQNNLNKGHLTMNKAIKALVTFLLSSGYALKKPKKEGSKGILIYDTITDIAKVERLAKACDFSVIQSDAEYDRGRLASPARTYIGPVTDNTMSEDEAIAHFLG
tara:strand:+ start:97 stop:429 length:333 start_codon:yes stop_codon:yes gene_type:complete